MRRSTRKIVLALVVALAGAAGVAVFAQASAIDDPVVLRIGDREVHSSTVQRALAGVPAFELQALGTTKFEILRRYVDEAMVRAELLAIAAKNKGALSDHGVQEQLSKASAGALVRKKLAALGGRSSIPKSDVEAYYKEHAAEYQTPERVRMAHIVVATKAEADALLTKVLADATREHWNELCAEKSLDPNSKRTAGDLGFVSIDGRSSEPKILVPKKLAEAAFALKNGDVGKEPIQTEAGWHIVWRRGSTPALTRTLEMEEPTIRELLFEKKQQETYKSLLDGLRAANPAQIDEDLLAVPTVDVGARPVPKPK